MTKIHNNLDQYFIKRTEDELFSGVVLIHQGISEIYSGAFGYADRDWQISNNLETRFDTASVTKLFTAVATLQLVEKGAFSLDEPVIDFLDLHKSAISQAVTVRHLLTHTSGIGDDVEEEAGEEYEELWATKPNYSVTKTIDFLPQFIHKSPNFPPGEGCRYCNCGYILLGLMIERVSGMNYRDFVRQHIFSRAGMLETDFFWMNRVNKNVAVGTDPIKDDDGKIIGWQKNMYSFPPIGSPDSGAYVTAGDLVRFLQAVQGEKLLSQELTQAFLTPQVLYQQREKWTLKYGYGLVFYEDPAGNLRFYQKEGLNAGCSAYLRYYPDSDMTLVILSNMMSGVWGPIWFVHDELMNSL